ncbi:hypothetical protein C2E23DRAFT_890379 [Lenzites betulinus]|nr:hypothetical protein C2E23DRAFT_890379 [Lenzites betulinus]
MGVLAGVGSSVVVWKAEELGPMEPLPREKTKWPAYLKATLFAGLFTVPVVATAFFKGGSYS